jgi:hypothetical protein
MPRAMRVEYPGAIYHVMDRGDRQEDIFVDDVDRQDLLKTLAEQASVLTFYTFQQRTAVEATSAKV